MQQLLDAGEVPRRLRGIGGVQRICQFLERRLPQQSHHKQNHSERFNANDFPEQQFAVGVSLFVFQTDRRVGHRQRAVLGYDGVPILVHVKHSTVFV